MTTTVALRCRCGAVRGRALDASPSNLNRAVCYCDDCQAYARWLGGDDLVDARGGSDIVQMAPSRLRIDAGHEHLRVMRLGPKGLMRWYADCCRTPVGNQMPVAWSPFVGVPAAFVDTSSQPLEALVGPVKMYVMGRFARGGCPPHAPPSVKPLDGLAVMGNLARWVVAGVRPQPFVDPATGAPRATPTVLSREERDALRTE